MNFSSLLFESSGHHKKSGIIVSYYDRGIKTNKSYCRIPRSLKAAILTFGGQHAAAQRSEISVHKLSMEELWDCLLTSGLQQEIYFLGFERKGFLENVFPIVPLLHAVACRNQAMVKNIVWIETDLLKLIYMFRLS
ncbi:hypothetical protein ACSBR1_005099 [Camellia fascicularis]